MARASFWIVLLVGLLAAALLLLPRWLAPPLFGQALGWTVVLFNVLIVVAAWLRSHHELLDAWVFVLAVALGLVAADWVAARTLGVLVFPTLGGERIGPVPVYVPGLWVAPLLIVVWLAEMTHAKSAALGVAVAVLGGTLVLVAGDWAGARLGLWLARGVRTVEGVALYRLPAFALLALATWLMFVQVQGRTIFAKALGGAAVAVFYAGALVVSYLGFRQLA